MFKTKLGKVVALLGAVMISASAWFFISPLLIDEHVDEALVFAGPPTAPEARTKAMQQVMADAAQKPDRTVEDSMMTESELLLLERGDFHDADSVHRGSGNALIYRLADGSHLLRLEDFKVTNGPDLAVYLVKHANPSSSAQVTSGFLNLGKLKGNVGNQNYAIPAGTDLSEFNSAVIWCELFGVLFSTAPLSEG
ncbi:MAG: hypothetical protein ACJAUG_000762 [Halioglobus sp.]|jgi:hypothetical protein